MRSELLIGPNLTIPQIRKPQGHVAPLRPTRSGVSRIANRRTPPLTSRRGPREHCGFVGSHPILTRFHGPGSGLTLMVTPLPHGRSGRARPQKTIGRGALQPRSEQPLQCVTDEPARQIRTTRPNNGPAIEWCSIIIRLPTSRSRQCHRKTPQLWPGGVCA